MRDTVRHINGYIFGFTIFILLIPLGLYELSKLVKVALLMDLA